MNDIFVKEKEYSDEVDRLRLNRVETSFYKYGPAKINFGDRLVDALDSHDLCINKYIKTKNKEYLLDAMNYLMFEFMYPQLENTYFEATSSSESAGISGMSYNELKEKY